MFQRKNDPTREEIRESAAQIRAEWDERTHRKRAGKDPESIGCWVPPGYSTRAIAQPVERDHN